MAGDRAAIVMAQVDRANTASEAQAQATTSMAMQAQTHGSFPPSCAEAPSLVCRSRGGSSISEIDASTAAAAAGASTASATAAPPPPPIVPPSQPPSRRTVYHSITSQSAASSSSSSNAGSSHEVPPDAADHRLAAPGHPSSSPASAGSVAPH